MLPVIIVNGRECSTDQATLNYEQIVAMADSGRSKECLHTIIYRIKKDGWEKSGTIYPGSAPVEVHPGMVISAMVTDNA